jgi:hypothetical protein
MQTDTLDEHGGGHRAATDALIVEVTAIRHHSDAYRT